MIVIINYNTGNVGSISNMIKKVNGKCLITDDNNIISKATKIILPGVGNYGRAIQSLKDKKIFDTLKNKINSNDCYILGICLGMQLLCEGSNESKGEGLGVFKGKCKKFSDESKDSQQTFMGWSNVFKKKDHPLFNNINEKNKFYFLHSYFYPMHEKYTYCYSTNKLEFSTLIIKDKIFGMQFHPERSHSFGQKILENFINL